MSSKPNYLNPTVAGAFADPRVAASYRHRPSYPPETFTVLAGLIHDSPRTVLDLGCGTGLIARPLAACADRIDAVDVSAAMIEEGRRLPGGDAPHIRWLVTGAEYAPLKPPYALITAGESLHWMDWDLPLPRRAAALTVNGVLAVLDLQSEEASGDQVLRTGVTDLIRRHSTLHEWRPDFDLRAELAARGLVRVGGQTLTAPALVRLSADQYVESFHARASLAWGRLHPEAAAAFDQALRQLVLDRVGPQIVLAIRAAIWWGRPQGPQRATMRSRLRP